MAASRSPSTIEEKSLAGAADDKAPVASDCAASPVQQSDSEAPPATEAGEKLGIPTIASLSLKDSEEANDATAARGDSSRLAVLSIDSTQSPAVSEEQPSGVLPPLLPALIVQNDGPVLRKVSRRETPSRLPLQVSAHIAQFCSVVKGAVALKSTVCKGRYEMRVAGALAWQRAGCACVQPSNPAQCWCWRVSGY